MTKFQFATPDASQPCHDPVRVILYTALGCFAMSGAASGQSANTESTPGPITNDPLMLTQQPGSCGCMDVVFVLDVTGSMSGAIGNLQDPVDGLPAVIDEALVLGGMDR